MTEYLSDWWSDGDYSECYYAWGHVDKVRFAQWVFGEQDPGGDWILPASVEHLWAVVRDDERFSIVSAGTPDSKPITRYRP